MPCLYLNNVGFLMFILFITIIYSWIMNIITAPPALVSLPLHSDLQLGLQHSCGNIKGLTARGTIRMLHSELLSIDHLWGWAMYQIGCPTEDGQHSKTWSLEHTVGAFNASSAAWAEAIIHWSARDPEHNRIKCTMFKSNVLIVCGFVLYMYIYTGVCVVL